MQNVKPRVIKGDTLTLNRLKTEYHHWQGMECRFVGDDLVVMPRRNRENLGGMK